VLGGWAGEHGLNVTSAFEHALFVGHGPRVAGYLWRDCAQRVVFSDTCDPRATIGSHTRFGIERMRIIRFRYGLQRLFVAGEARNRKYSRSPEIADLIDGDRASVKSMVDG
jgi:hypothetical protein